MPTAPALTMNDGLSIPQLGFGVFQIPQDETETSVGIALDVGYRLIDTAQGYQNEEGVGAAIAAAGIPREELFITTKLTNSEQGYDQTLAAFDESLRKLGLDVVDLVLVHWPIPMFDLYGETWRAFVRLQQEGRVRSIGVSNFEAEHMERIVGERESPRRSTRSSCTWSSHKRSCARSMPSTGSSPSPGDRSARARGCLRTVASSRWRSGSSGPRRRWCCDGTCSWATS